MKIPQIILIIWLALGLGFSIATHGKPRGQENWVGKFIAIILLIALLWWGGFWDGIYSG